MSGQPSPPSPSSHRRRSSLVEMFAPLSASKGSASYSTSAGPTSQIKRAVSVSTPGLGATSPIQSSPFNAFAKQRRGSLSSSASGSPEFRNSFSDEPVVIEEGDQMDVPMDTPGSPSFARRVSFGAQALRDVKGGSVGRIGDGGRRPSSSLFTLSENHAPEGESVTSPVASKTATARGKSRGLSLCCCLCSMSSLFQNQKLPFTARKQLLTYSLGEAFNWSDALRDKTKRSPSFSGSANPFASHTARAKPSIIAAVAPPKEMPKAPVVPTKPTKPDHLGERMLRGDFMMD